MTGKGGVGKSAVAASLAMKLVAQGKKTLLVELGDQSFYQDYLNLETVSYQPRSYKGLFDVALWSGATCLREYALHLLKIKKLYELFFENPVSRTLMQVAPGLSELAILGKATSDPRKIGPKVTYDCFVIDAYATGHFLALLRAPIGMAEAFRLGPMAEQSRSILKVLRDPKLTFYHIVSLPEELPTQESIELEKDLREIVQSSARLWLNKWVSYPEGLSEKGPAFEKDFLHREQRQEEIWNELQKNFSQVQKLPFVFETEENLILRQLEKEIEL